MSSSRSSPLGFGVIGCGRVVDRRVAPAIREVSTAHLAAFASRDMARAQQYADAHGAPAAYDSLDAMLADDRVHAVYIATPNHLHAATAIACFRAGKHVLVDKPMALSAAEALGMIDAAQESGRRLGLLHQQRFHTVNQRLFELIRSGRLGRVLSVRAQMGFWYNLVDNWRMDRAMSGGGPAMDLAPHALDILMHAVGPVCRVDARTHNLHFAYKPAATVAAGVPAGRRRRENAEKKGVDLGKPASATGSDGVEDHCTMRMEFAAGAVGTAEFSYCSHHYGGRLEVFGTEGTFIADGSLQQADRYRLWLRYGDEEQPVEEGPASPCFERLITDFVEAVREDRDPTVSADDGLAVMRVLDAIYESARCARTIEVA